jgi:uncharacterized Zn finger protein
MAPGGWNDRWNRFPESVPLRAEGGLATSKQRGRMAGTWWSQRFVAVLESYGLGARMGRGRRYARTGQLLSLDVSPGLLVAQVQGSRRTPYLVTIAMREPTAKQWNAIDDTMRTRVGFVATLLAGEVPADLEAVFSDAGTTLLPTTWSHVTARCSCPDPANPCKHIAAALYVFADQLDADPWLLLAWRGRTRDQVLAPFRSRSGADEESDGPVSLVAPWWPFGSTASAAIDALRGADAAVPTAEPSEPPDAVLQRCAPLGVTAYGTNAANLLSLAYELMNDSESRPS